MKNLILIYLLLSISLTAQTQTTWDLKKCMDYALSHNISIEKYRLDKETATLNQKQSKYNRLPTVSGAASGTLSRGSSINNITGDYEQQTLFNNNLSVSADMVLYQGNKLNLLINENGYLVDESELTLIQKQNEISLDLMQAYVQALYSKEEIDIAKEDLAIAEKQYQTGKAKFDLGAIARLDLASLSTQLAESQYTLVSAKNDYAQKLLSLKQLLELPVGQDFEITPTTNNDSIVLIPSKEEVFELAKTFLPDLKIYDIKALRLENAVELTQSEALPTVSLSTGLGAGYTSANASDYVNQLDNNFYQNIGLSVSVPIFSKHQNKTNRSLALIDQEDNELDRQSAYNDLYADVETAWLNAGTYQAQWKASKVSRDNAKLTYDLSIKKFEFGAMTVTELAVSRTDYLEAQQRYLQNKYMTLLYEQLLNFYQGKGFSDL